jgi:hypothetical protein
LCLTKGSTFLVRMPSQVIKISGARQHNLKNLHVEIPREKLVVFTGLSGSGKSSLCRRPTPLRQSLLVGPENAISSHKSCVVPATADQPLQQVVKPRQPQRGIDCIARESRHFVRTLNNFWMAKSANSNLPAGGLVQTGLREKRGLGWRRPAVMRPCFIQCHRNSKQRFSTLLHCFGP